MAHPLHSTNPLLRQHQLKHEKLVVECTITANATPASKVHATDLPGIVVLRTEGKVAEADAIEDLSAQFTTAADATNGQIGVVVLGSAVGSIKKVKKVSVTQITATGTAIVVTPAATAFKTAGGNIGIDITLTGTSLDTESPTFVLEIDYELN